MPIRTRRIMWGSLPWVVLLVWVLGAQVALVFLVLPAAWQHAPWAAIGLVVLAVTFWLCLLYGPAGAQLVNFRQRLTLDDRGIHRAGPVGWSFDWPDVESVAIHPYPPGKLLVVEPRSDVERPRPSHLRGPNGIQRSELLSVALRTADAERLVAELRRRGIAVES